MSNIAIAPIPDDYEGDGSDLSAWQDGNEKPVVEGPYLRDFHEGEAISVYRDGKWRRDGFFTSDIQDVGWRGLIVKVD